MDAVSSTERDLHIRAPSREICVFGYRFHPLPKGALLDLIFRERRSGDRLTIASANLHGLYMFERSPEYRELHSRPNTHVIVDGMPVVWMLRLLGHRVEREHRTTWLDWFEEALDRAAAEGRRVFVLGHSRKTLDVGLARAAKRWPTLAISGAEGFFDIEDEAACEQAVNAVKVFSPDLLFVGMGMPKQEIFACRYAEALGAPVLGLGGAAFAYFAGEQPAPPRWMGQAGLEWLHRLSANPTRLAGRYFSEPLCLAFALAFRLATERARDPRWAQWRNTVVRRSGAREP